MTHDQKVEEINQVLIHSGIAVTASNYMTYEFDMISDDDLKKIEAIRSAKLDKGERTRRGGDPPKVTRTRDYYTRVSYLEELYTTVSLNAQFQAKLTKFAAINFNSQELTMLAGSLSSYVKNPANGFALRTDITVEDIVASKADKETRTVCSVLFMNQFHKQLSLNSTLTTEGVKYDIEGTICTFNRGIPTTKEAANKMGAYCSSSSSVSYVFPCRPDDNKVLGQLFKYVQTRRGPRASSFVPNTFPSRQDNELAAKCAHFVQGLAGKPEYAKLDDVTFVNEIQIALFESDLYETLAKAARDETKFCQGDNTKFVAEIPTDKPSFDQSKTEIEVAKSERNASVGKHVWHRVMNTFSRGNDDAHDAQQLDCFKRRYPTALAKYIEDRKKKLQQGTSAQKADEDEKGEVVQPTLPNPPEQREAGTNAPATFCIPESSIVAVVSSDPELLKRFEVFRQTEPVLFSDGKRSYPDGYTDVWFSKFTGKTADKNYEGANVLTILQVLAGEINPGTMVHVWLNANRCLSPGPEAIELFKGYDFVSNTKSGGLHTPDFILSLCYTGNKDDAAALQAYKLTYRAIFAYQAYAKAATQYFMYLRRHGVIDIGVEVSRMQIRLGVGKPIDLRPGDNAHYTWPAPTHSIDIPRRAIVLSVQEAAPNGFDEKFSEEQFL
jgi:hypothetical protein